MPKAEPTRLAPAVPEAGAVNFLIGMRINQLWRFWSWLPVFSAMPRMLIELGRNPELGMVGRPRTLLSGRVILVWQQWTSFEALEAYAKSAAGAHLPAWRDFNRRSRGNGAVGIFHETYLIDPTSVEGVYINMKPVGLGNAFGVVAAEGSNRSAAGRLGRNSSGDR